jgi:hypothetical protein
MAKRLLRLRRRSIGPLQVIESTAVLTLVLAVWLVGMKSGHGSKYSIVRAAPDMIWSKNAQRLDAREDVVDPLQPR